MQLPLVHVRTAIAAWCAILAIALHAEDGVRPAQVPAELEASFMQSARQTQAQADQFEAEHRTFEAMQQFEKLIADAALLPPELQHTYQFHVILAASHLDAARTRIIYGGTLRDSLKMREENQRLVLDHLNLIPTLVVAASNEVGQGPDRPKFKADAYKILGAGEAYKALTNNSTHDLDVAITAYQKLATIDPAAAKQAKHMVSYLQGVKREMTKSILSYDNIVHISSALVKEAVPDVGGWLAAGIELGAHFYKEHRSDPEPPKAR